MWVSRMFSHKKQNEEVTYCELIKELKIEQHLSLNSHFIFVHFMFLIWCNVTYDGITRFHHDNRHLKETRDDSNICNCFKLYYFNIISFIYIW